MVGAEETTELWRPHNIRFIKYTKCFHAMPLLSKVNTLHIILPLISKATALYTLPFYQVKQMFYIN